MLQEIASGKVTISAITPAQSRAARGLLDWSRDQLAERCGIAKRTIVRFEASEGDTRDVTLHAIRTAFEAGGVEFTNGDSPGVKLKQRLPLSENDVRSMLRSFVPANPGSMRDLKPKLIEARQQGGWPSDLSEELESALEEKPKLGFPGKTAGTI